MPKKIHMLTYFIVVFSLLSIGYTGSYFSDTEMSTGFFTAADDWPSTLPCTRTLGYWKTHDEAWPVDEITIGGVTYTKAEAIDWLETPVQGDMTIVMFYQLVPAKLNVAAGCEASCITDTIAAADDWMATYGPVGNGVPEDPPSPWETGEPLKNTLNQYNNGELCAPHCDSPPYEPINPMPYNDATGVGINPTLSVYVSDPNGDTMNVSFYDASDNSLVDMVANVESNITVSVAWLGLDYGITYEWYVVAEDYEGSTQSDTWRFTTNHPPESSLISPTNNSEGIDLSPSLKVRISDPDGDAMNVSFYDASNNQPILQDVNVVDGDNASVTWNDLDYSHTYSWYVIVNDSMTETQSDTWSFTTKSRPSGGSGGNSGGGSSGGGSPPSNNPPIADAGGPYSGFVDIPITFNGSGNTDDGTITSYLWNFGDNQSGTGISPTHTYTEVGTYNVTLTVTDNGGLTDTNITKATITSLLEINNVIATPSIQTIGEHVNITCTITNTSQLVDVILNISYPNNNSTTLSIYQNNMENSTTYYFNRTYNLLGIYEYYIWAYDIENHTTISETYQFSIATDIAPPEISNISVTPEEQEINGYINITATVTDNIGVKDVLLNITSPDNSTSNITMTRIDGTDIYYYNSTYSDMGDYTFFILAADTNNNTAKSNIYHFSIVDLQPPTTVDNTPETAYKNETFTFNATITDNNIVADVYVEYWYETGNHTNISMNNTDNVYWEKTIIIPSNFNILQYVIHAKDTSNNWNHTEIKSITLLENN